MSQQMTRTFEKAILGLGTEFPDTLYILHHPASGKYGCFLHAGTHGVACFSTENGALRFSELIDLCGMTSHQVSFDEAREVAKGRPHPVTALILLDDPSDPHVHFVK